MRLFPPSLEIGELEGFSKEKDILGRASHGRRLTNLLSNVTDPMVIAIDGQWGTGKTTFLKMWAGELRKLGFPVIYFDAFANDYSEDAFAALAGQIVGLADAHSKEIAGTADRIRKAAIGAGRVLIRSSLKIGTKAATMGILELADLKEVASDIASEATRLEDRYIGELIGRQDEQRNAIQTFKQALSDLPALLQTDAGIKRPLVFIIDELDRCRPVFALEILERIKHFFSVEGVQFVLGAYFHQLANSVVLAYGPGVNGLAYLQKFISIVYQLIDDQRYEHEKTGAKFLTHLSEVLDFKQEHRDTVGSAVKIFRWVDSKQDLGLRDLEKMMTNLALALAFLPTNFFKFPPILAGLCVIKALRPDLYAKAKLGRLTFSDAAAALSLDLSSNDSFMRWIVESWQFATGADMKPERLQEFTQLIFQYHLGERDTIVPFIANNIVDRFIEK